MSDSKHTPGPWIATADESSPELGEFTIRDSDGGCIADVRNPYADYDMQVEYASQPDCRIEHDARLIAAAPELLEALKFAGPQLEVLHKHYSGSDAATIYKIIGMCRAAIAKAEGRP